MKFLITPNYRAPYDQRMVNGLADGFRAIGHQAHALPGPILPTALEKECRALAIDVVIQVNRTRPKEPPLPSSVRYISWFQDVFPETMNGFAETFREGDILYALGDPEVLGLNVSLPCYVGSLVSGVDESVFNFKPTNASNIVDFSICGFIPPPLDFSAKPLNSNMTQIMGLVPNNLRIQLRTLVRRYLRKDYVPVATRIEMMNTVRRFYRPLRGELDIHELALAMRKKVIDISEAEQIDVRTSTGRQLHLKNGTHPTAVDSQENFPPFEKQISYFAREYPRLLDREALISEVLCLSKSLELYGLGWREHPPFQPFAKGVINKLDELLTVYCRSRINLANNTHGLGLHSRTLECMAVGGFIFTHASPHDSKPGGMLTAFEPNVHFGTFTLDDFQIEARRWLASDSLRRQVGARAAAAVKERHCWRHRAQQILNDLEK